MTVRKKALFIIGIALISMMIIQYVFSRIIILRSFSKLEGQFIESNVKRSLEVLSNELFNLDTMTRDYANWDDTYAFIQNANENYIKVNLVDSTFKGLRLNLIVFVDSSGRIVFSKAFDIREQKQIPVPGSLQEHLFAKTPLLFKGKDITRGVSGIIMLSQWPMLIASRPILTSEVKGPVRGTLIMGRYLDLDELKHLLSRIVQYPIAVYRYHDTQIPDDLKSARLALSEKTPLFIKPIENGSIAGYSLLNDIYGRPILVLRVDMPRLIYKQGLASVFYFSIFILILGVVLGLIILLFLENTILSRLVRLSNGVRNVSAIGDFSERISMTGKDELSELTQTINRMLHSLQQSHNKLQAAHDELKATQEQLVQSAKMASIGQLAGGVAHEINNPLTGVLNNLQLINTQIEQKNKISFNEFKQVLGDIEESALRCNKIIANLLNFSHPSRGAFQLVSINEIIEKVIALIEDEMKLERIVIQKKFQTNLPQILADPQLLQQAIFNIISNARWAIKKKSNQEVGIITIDTKYEPQTARIHICISDNGVGIPKKNLERIFEPFFTTKNIGEGTGLGLSIVYSIVRQHNGSIKAESQVDAGATFTISLPCFLEKEYLKLK